MPDQRIGIGAAIGPQSPRNGRGDAPADAAVRHHLHEHENREDQGDPGERVRSKKADEIGLSHPDKRLDNEHYERRQCKAEHRRCDWPGENARWHLARGR